MEWIPTAERLPDDETPVLLVRKGSVVVGERCWDHPGHEDTYQSYWYWSCVDEHWNDDQGEATVSHWMPLPALPFNAESNGALAHPTRTPGYTKETL